VSRRRIKVIMNKSIITPVYVIELANEDVLNNIEIDKKDIL
jgi:hypothetical protein